MQLKTPLNDSNMFITLRLDIRSSTGRRAPRFLATVVLIRIDAAVRRVDACVRCS
jgi:hypothetical protein